MALPADFSKIYGSTATGGLTPISDVNYTKGWEFVGANPPTKNDFSYLQNLSDLKSQWLYSNKLQRADPFGDIKADGTAAVSTALANLGLEDMVNALIKTKNLSDLPDKGISRTNLEVYSKTEINARVGMATLSVTNPALGTRTIINNPFGNSTPVICVAEILHAPTRKWISSKWIWHPTGYATYGVEAFYLEGTGIVLVTGNYAYMMNTNASNGAPIDTGSTDYTTPSPVRIRVTKVAP